MFGEEEDEGDGVVGEEEEEDGDRPAKKVRTDELA